MRELTHAESITPEASDSLRKDVGKTSERIHTDGAADQEAAALAKLRGAEEALHRPHPSGGHRGGGVVSEGDQA